MIRTTDAMIKAMNVQKLVERRAANVAAMASAKAANRADMASIFAEFICVDDAEIAVARDWLRNPAA